MSFLLLVLSFKILVTIVLLCVPLFLLPKSRLDKIFAFGDPSENFYRLYGVAMTALLTAYLGGWFGAVEGRYIKEIVFMGIVSNVGAAVTMVFTGYAAKKRPTVIVFGLIGAGFIVAAVSPGFAMSPLW